MVVLSPSPREWYGQLISQGYTKEHAARRAGIGPKALRGDENRTRGLRKTAGTASPPTPRSAPRILPTSAFEPGVPIFQLPIVETGPQNWRRDALCAQVDPEIFFPAKGASPREAKKVCMRCTVREDCLEWALDLPHGIAGGLSAQERQVLRRKRRKPVATAA